MKEPRFTVKWNNGWWKVFDTVRYADVQPIGLKKEAEELADAYNRGLPQPRGRRA
jgi:hypothetical protein